MRNVVLAAGIAALLILPGLSLADPPWGDNPGHGHGKHYDSDYGDRSEGGPPPWAPAHGYRRKHGEDHDHYRGDDREYDRGDDRYRRADDRYPTDFGIPIGTCSREAVGAILGGAVGAAVGSRVGAHEDRQLATVTGAVIGVLVGRSIGRSMDDADQACTGQVLERASDRQSVMWRNPDTRVQYQVTPTRTYQRDGRYCREYTTNATVGGSRQTLYGTACRNADGSWQMHSAPSHG